MFCSSALNGRAVRVVLVGTAVAGMTILSVGSSWADSTEQTSGQSTHHAAKSTEVLGVPVTTAAWALLGLILVVAAMVITSRSRHQVLVDLRAQALGANPPESPTADRGPRVVKAAAGLGEARAEAGCTIPAVS